MSYIFRPGDLVTFKDALSTEKKGRRYMTLKSYEDSEVSVGKFGDQDVGMVIRKDEGGFPTLILTSGGQLGVISMIYLKRIK